MLREQVVDEPTPAQEAGAVQQTSQAEPQPAEPGHAGESEERKPAAKLPSREKGWG